MAEKEAVVEANEKKKTADVRYQRIECTDIACYTFQITFLDEPYDFYMIAETQEEAIDDFKQNLKWLDARDDIQTFIIKNMIFLGRCPIYRGDPIGEVASGTSIQIGRLVDKIQKEFDKIETSE